VRPLAQAADDNAIEIADTGRDIQELGSHSEHRAELVKLGPTGTRDQVRQNVGIAIEVCDAKAPIERAPLRRADEVLVSFHNDGALGGLSGENTRRGEGVGIQIDPGRRGGRTKLVEVRVEHEYVESSTQELEDGYR
jgi:hypothetical protein